VKVVRISPTERVYTVEQQEVVDVFDIIGEITDMFVDSSFDPPVLVIEAVEADDVGEI